MALLSPERKLFLVFVVSDLLYDFVASSMNALLVMAIILIILVMLFSFIDR